MSASSSTLGQYWNSEPYGAHSGPYGAYSGPTGGSSWPSSTATSTPGKSSKFKNYNFLPYKWYKKAGFKKFELGWHLKELKKGRGWNGEKSP